MHRDRIPDTFLDQYYNFFPACIVYQALQNNLDIN